MSKRLQVLVPDAEMDEIRRIASRHELTVGEWVRQVLRTARRQEPAVEASRKLKAIREAAQYCFPTADIRDMIAEIERGYER
jgi:hypothetical protein